MQYCMYDLYISVQLLRKTGCKLPVEIWHLGDLNADLKDLFSSFKDVNIMNLVTYDSYITNLRINSTQILNFKASVLIHTSYQNILFLDPKVRVLHDPTILFESAPFLKTGLVFWKDLYKTPIENPIWHILGVPCTDEFETAPNYFMIRKSDTQMYKSLYLANYFQRNLEMYDRFLNENDAFRYAWKQFKNLYHIVEPNPGLLLSDTECGVGVVHFMPFVVSMKTPYPLFLHSFNDSENHLSDQLTYSKIMHYSRWVEPDSSIVSSSCIRFSNKSKLDLTDFNERFPKYTNLAIRIENDFLKGK
ncbi:mannosyltransferase putative-domain-containing protein [Globomyces pollinis-pini]|nr:mannosyltransferase putative-domain-containing protein [Globomyces pollinis-pini]